MKKINYGTFWKYGQKDDEEDDERTGFKNETNNIREK